MATFVLEDLSAAMEVMVFPRTMSDYGHVLEDDAIVCVKGRLDTREDAPKMIAMEVTRPDLVLDGGPPVRLRMRPNSLSEERIAALKRLLTEHPGDSQVFIQFEGTDKVTVLRLGDEFCVDPSNGLFAELRILLGADCIA
jgi:DNA polymerase-3 subunit alpha